MTIGEVEEGPARPRAWKVNLCGEFRSEIEAEGVEHWRFGERGQTIQFGIRGPIECVSNSKWMAGTE